MPLYPAGEYPGDMVTTHSPGGGVPFSGHGSGYEGGALAWQWAIASQGLIQYTQRFQWSRWKSGPGAWPTVTCCLCLMQASREHAVQIDGRWYHAHHAPKPRVKLDDADQS